MELLRNLFLELKSAERRHLLLLILLSFSISIFQNILGLFVVLLVINWLWLPKYLSNIKQTQFILPSLFYIFHVVALLWSTNLEFGLFDVQIKLSLFLFPLIMGTTNRLNSGDFEKILSAYVIGCTLVILIGLANSIFIFFNGEATFIDLYGQNISPSLHIGYFAMYMNFAIIILLYRLFVRTEDIFKVVNILRMFLILVFTIAIFFSTSRNGFLAMFLIFLLGIIYAIIKSRKWMLVTLAALTIWIVLSSLLKDYKIQDSNYHGFKQVAATMEGKELKKTASESTAVRVLVWRTALDLIKQSPFIGAGTGDIKDELLMGYEVNGYTSALKKKYNAHNQYLQTAAALGIPAALILIFMLISPLFYNWKRWHFLGLFLAIIVGVACLTESVLEVQAGVVYYAFFASLFAQNMQKDYGTNFIDNPLISKRKQK